MPSKPTLDNPWKIFKRDQPWADAKAYLINRFNSEDHGYDLESVLRIEEENYNLFEQHPELHIDPSIFVDHYTFYPVLFGTRSPSGVGILDIGCGESGPFLCGQNTFFFSPPRVGVDPYEARCPDGWFTKVMDGDRVLAVFGEQSFDFVQCMETLEHVDQKKAYNIARQMLKIARKYACITSAPICVHIGPNTKEYLDRNLFMGYQGQPDFRGLQKMGYKVWLMGGYGLGMGMRILASWSLERDGKPKVQN
jgi:hypothetical protein